MTESADTDGTVRTYDRVFHPKILTTLRAYDGRTFLSDLGAGLTVAMVALPLAMAIAIASGANPGVGLVTAIVAGLTISALGGSRVQIGGPTGAFIVVVYAVIADHGYDGLVIATFMAGIILLIAGFLRAGSLIRHIPEPVINGFTIGIAVIIASSQVADFFGLGVEGKMPADFLPKLAVLWEASGSVSVPSAIVALATLVMIVLFRRAAPKLPGLVVAVGLTSAAVAMFELDVDTIASRFGAIAPHLPFPSLPELSFDRIVELLPSAIIIAFLARRRVTAVCAGGRPHGGHCASIKHRSGGSGCGQLRVRPVWRASSDRSNRPDRNQYPGRSEDAGGRDHAFAVPAGLHDVRSPAGRPSGASGPCRRSGAHGMEHGRAAAFHEPHTDPQIGSAIAGHDIAADGSGRSDGGDRRRRCGRPDASAQAPRRAGTGLAGSGPIGSLEQAATLASCLSDPGRV
ncbi:SulP family inorganic anion transporter [Hoeflea alexandrii]|nr:SulP family inorganic anion transporter [Hoeflea alexandrii]MCY0151696.1 SulP family inorganic anion transporter [Hoeflea alexandrii]